MPSAHGKDDGRVLLIVTEIILRFLFIRGEVACLSVADRMS